MEQIKENIEKGKRAVLSTRNVFMGILVLIVIVLLSGGGYGLRMYKNQLKDEVKKSDSIQNVLDQNEIIYEEQYQKGIDSVAKTKVQRKTYYNDFITWKTLAEKLYEERLVVNSRNYPVQYLDTLAEQFQYLRKKDFVFHPE